MARTVLVFGVFDGLHDGHRDFLGQARELGDHLIVVVARDAVAEKLKNRRPKFSAEERVRSVRARNLADRVVLGDAELGGWGVIKKYVPDIVALGYDQDELERSLRAWCGANGIGIEFKKMQSHRPETHHSSIINSNGT